MHNLWRTGQKKPFQWDKGQEIQNSKWIWQANSKKAVLTRGLALLFDQGEVQEEKARKYMHICSRKEGKDSC